MTTAANKYRCHLGALRLCLRETADPNTFDVRVVAKPANPFAQALTIRAGTVLGLERRKGVVRFVKVRVFAPRIQYGRTVAGGVLVCYAPS